MTRRELTFTDGIAVGIGALAMIAVLILAGGTDRFNDMYRDMGHAPLPAMSRLVLSQPWRIGVPALLIAGWVWALGWRPHRYVTLGAMALTLVVVLGWFYGLYAPIFALAGNISG